MMNKLSKISTRDKRALLILAAFGVFYGIFYLGSDWIDEWIVIRGKLKTQRKYLADMAVDESGQISARQKVLLAAVPVFVTPETIDKQEILFRDELNSQIRKVGINSKILEPMATKKLETKGSYKMLRFQCKAKCSLNQILDLLTALRDNPYYVGIEEIQIKPDQKNRSQIDLTLTVSTFVKVTPAAAKAA